MCVCVCVHIRVSARAHASDESQYANKLWVGGGVFDTYNVRTYYNNKL